MALLLLSTGAWFSRRTPAPAPSPSPTPRTDATAIAAVEGLLKRILPNHTGRFVFEWIPPDNERDVFEIESRDGKTVIRGNTGVSMASGLNHYLKYHCNCHISLNYNQLDMPEPLPAVTEKIRIRTPFKYRNFFNYCSFSYTMAWWDWEQWEKMIDYLALNGVNMPLAIVGQAAVWQEVYRELGLSKQQIEDFLVGPAYLPWGWMGNIDGLGGPLPEDWIRSHTTLQQQILERERSFGMTPILQGFTGHVPEALKVIFPNAQLHRTTPWAGMPGTWFLDPRSPLFQQIGRSFIKKQVRRYGTDHLYNADCFNEINPHTNDPAYIKEVGKAVFRAMQTADPEAIWVFQGWFLYFQPEFWKPPQARALLMAVPDDRMLGLDLWGEEHPVWKKTEAFYGKPWIWNVFCINGQKVNMSGHLQTMQANLAEVLDSENAGNLQGIGMMMEGFGYNPVVQEFMLEKTWRPGMTDLDEWVTRYARRRYGSEDPRVVDAWRRLLKGPYSRPAPTASIICTTPRLVSLKPKKKPVSKSENETVTEACRLLLECADTLGRLETFRFDLVHVTREMLDRQAPRLLRNVTAAYKAGDHRALSEAGRRFLQLIKDMDTLLGAHRRFLLGRWLSDARKWGDTPDERVFYQWNARAVVTMWEPARKSQLRDYASKQWNGLLKDFYLPRWRLFLDQLKRSLKEHQPFARRAFMRDLREQEFQWLRQRLPYITEPKGDPVETARRLFNKYNRPSKPSPGNKST